MPRLKKKPSEGGSEIGVRLVKLMDAKGWTQRDLAARAGVSQAGIGKLVRGDTQNGRVDTLAAVATALGVSFAWLVTGEDATAAAAPKDVYPNRGTATGLARSLVAAGLLGLDERDVAPVLGIGGFKADEEPDVGYWFGLIERNRDRRLGLAPQRKGERAPDLGPPPAAAKYGRDGGPEDA